MNIEFVLWWMLGTIAVLYVLSFPIEWYLNWLDRRSMYVEDDPVEDDRDWQTEFKRIVSGRVK